MMYTAKQVAQCPMPIIAIGYLPPHTIKNTGCNKYILPVNQLGNIEYMSCAMYVMVIISLSHSTCCILQTASTTYLLLYMINATQTV